MQRSHDRQGVVERVVLLLVVTLFFFATPVIYAWAQDDSPWYLAYVLWLVIIAWSAWGQYRTPRHDV